MQTTANRISTHGPAVVQPLEGLKKVRMCHCHYKGCKAKFPTKQGLGMHIGRVHTKTIPTASSRRIKEGLASKKVESNGHDKFDGLEVDYPKKAKTAQLSCCVTGPGLRVEFATEYLPTVLHTIALALGGK